MNRTQEIHRIDIALEVLARLHEKRVGNGRLRDAISVVRSELRDDRDDLEERRAEQ